MNIKLTHLKAKMNIRQKYVLLLNNLGGCTPLEMAVLTEEITKSDLMCQFDLIIGPDMLMTSLDMHGFSISILPLSDQIAEALTFKVEPRAWPTPVSFEKPIVRALPCQLSRTDWVASENPLLKAVIQKCCSCLLYTSPSPRDGLLSRMPSSA